MQIDKVIVALQAALLAKYGQAGLARIAKALKDLIAADKRRGLATIVVHLDEADDMAGFGGHIAHKPDARAVKGAIDRIAAAAQPHYILLLGGPDVMPMVHLLNPAHGGKDGDSDRWVPSDLPYACEAPYSTNANRFRGPTRVVGRLPDLMAASEPTLLTRLIMAAARAKPRPRSEYQSSFSLSAAAWAASTQLSLLNTFGHAKSMHQSPHKGPHWRAALLAPRVHFINCHGAHNRPEYYGQPPGVEDYPVSHHSKSLHGKISAGTVVAAECCYGAQLYDPARSEGHKGIALTYLEDGAACVFGSTTIAYGPSEGNGSADLICQYFVQQVLAGASLGRAALEARQKFAGSRTHLDPIDLKTLAKFYLLGDPSAQPVGFSAHALTRTKAFKKAFAKTQDRTVRDLRRERLERDGRHLGKALPPLRSSAEGPSDTVRATLDALERESGMHGEPVRSSFDVSSNERAREGKPPRRVHVVQGRKLVENAGHPVVRVVALIATEENGELLHVRRVHSR
jgi:hypothetical protein